jgi:hypothetical protein
MHIGHSSLSTATHPLALRKILHALEIAKHLLSVHKFSRENDVFFEYHPWHFSIKDRQSRRSLLDGPCKSGLYPIKSSDLPALKHALTAGSASYSQWYARLGHPSPQVLRSILHLNKIPCSRESLSSVCNACQIAKSHQLPYITSVHRSSSPLELIFSDVWGHTPSSIGGFKYYISFIDDFSKFSRIYLMHDRTEAPRIFMEFKTHVERLLDKLLNVFNPIGVGNTRKFTILSFALLALLIVFCVHTHTNKMGQLNENIVTL